ncbi:hypothetical protein BDZ89DRAFT_1130636 [Hymenopellis radicata]|nr:hypothetical protein BDZ89DRAFT_1130636 [Hymenopellis radicata]
MIPARLVCKGKSVPEHKGLAYTICTSCHDFNWLDPTAVDERNRQRSVRAAAEASYAQMPPGGPPDPPPIPSSPPFSSNHPDYDDDPNFPKEFASYSPPMAQSSTTPLDPALFLPSPPATQASMPTSFLPSPPATQASIPTSFLSSSSKPPCTAPRCRRVQGSSKCQTRQCAQCCKGGTRPCTIHKPSAKRQSSASSSSVPGPPPINPRLPDTGDDVPGDEDDDDLHLGPRRYAKPMPAAHHELYQRLHEERARRLQAAEDRKANETRLARQARFVCWYVDGAQPLTLTEQGIASWPYYNPSKSSRCMTHLSLDSIPNNTIDVYNWDFGLWFNENIDSILRVDLHPLVLLRHPNVTDCPGLDQWTSHSKTPLVTGRPKKTAASRGLTLDIPHPSTTPSSSSSSSPSPLSSQPSLPTTTASSPIDIDEDDNLDSYWSQECVHIPAGDWPACMYARDMAKGLVFMISKKTGAGESTTERFTRVFPGVDWVRHRAAYYQQRDAWVNSTTAERERALQTLRTGPRPMWIDWRKNTSGWVNRTRRN